MAKLQEYYNWPEHQSTFDEERDLKHYRVWMFDSLHNIPALKPFDSWNTIGYINCLPLQYGAETLCLPTSKGYDWRTIGPFLYIGVIEPSEEEQRQREPMFRERIRPWIEDFEKEWRGKLVPELMQHYHRLMKVDLKKLTNIELRTHFEDWLWNAAVKAWNTHFLAMYASFYIYILFEDICKEILGIDDKHPQFKALMSGFENKMFETDRELWRLSDRASELGLERLFQATPDDEELLSKLRGSDAGRRWLNELNEFLMEYGWRVPRWCVVSHPTWVEKPSLAIPDIRRAMAKGGAFALDQERRSLVRKRAEVEKQLLSRVSIEKREWFEKLMRAAQWSGAFSEEHNFYCEGFCQGLGRHISKEFGERFARAGVIDDPEDVYFLVPQEIRWYSVSMGKVEAHKLVRKRKEQWQEFLKIEPPTEEVPLFLGDPTAVPALIPKDPILRIVIAFPIVKPELKADLYGSASAPGVVEGTARVIMSDAQIPEIKAGDIVVTVTTSPVWTPVFGVIKGIVADGGGSLSHAVIVGREYGIPVVAGVIEATRKIKTGDRIRVDGDNGCVYVLR